MKLPPDLAQLLARREARVTGVRRLAERSYVVADSPSGRLFARISGDPADEARIRHEVSVRRLIGADGALRTPAVVASGDTWLLEPYIATRPIRGPACMDLVIAAAARVADLSLEAPLPAPSRSRDAGATLAAASSPTSVGRHRAPRDAYATRRRCRRHPATATSAPRTFSSTSDRVGDRLGALRPASGRVRPRAALGLLDDPDDRDRVFEGAVAIVGETHEETWQPFATPSR